MVDVTQRCVACGKPIKIVRGIGPPISLNNMYWTHFSWWANRTHAAIPQERIRKL